MMETRFKHNTFGKRLKSMCKVDFRRMFTTPLFYIIVGICLVMPVLILIMTTMMAGSVTTDPTTGAETVIEGFTNAWQIIGTASGEGAGASMDMMSMCNINLLYFFAAVLVCLFVTEDFKCGYAKNLFTVRAGKSDYVISKSLVCFAGGACMIFAFFLGTVIGGMIAGLPFDTGAGGARGVVLCLIAKMLLMAVFVPIYLLLSVAAKQKTWISVVGSLCAGMLLFMMVPMMAPLDATGMHVFMCLVGGAACSVGIGAVSNLLLRKTALV